MRAFVVALLSIVFFILQTTYLQLIAVRGIVPNIIFVLLISYALIRGKIEGGLLGLWVGFLQDLFFGREIGLYMLIYGYSGYLAGYFQKHFYKDNYIIPLFIITGMNFLNNFLLYIFTYLIRGKTDLGFYFINIILPEMIYTSIISLFIYRGVLFVNNKLELREMK